MYCSGNGGEARKVSGGEEMSSLVSATSFFQRKEWPLTRPTINDNRNNDIRLFEGALCTYICMHLSVVFQSYCTPCNVIPVLQKRKLRH